MDEKKAVAKPIRAHTVHMENRERVVVTGVEDLDNFNEDEVNFETDSGYVTITGVDLHMARLNLEDGQLIIEGVINGIAYSSDAGTEHSGGGGFFSKLFK